MVKKGTERINDGLGRPTRLTEERATAIYDHIASGRDPKDAAILVGIDVATYYRWLRTATKAEPKERRQMSALERRCIDFRHGIEDAEARFRRSGEARIDAAGTTVVKLVTIVEKADGEVITTTKDSTPDWKATAWRLERRWPERYGSKGTVEVSGPEGGPVEFALPDILAKLTRLQEEREDLDPGHTEG